MHYRIKRLNDRLFIIGKGVCSLSLSAFMLDAHKVTLDVEMSAYLQEIRDNARILFMVDLNHVKEVHQWMRVGVDGERLPELVDMIDLMDHCDLNHQPGRSGDGGIPPVVKITYDPNERAEDELQRVCMQMMVRHCTHFHMGPQAEVGHIPRWRQNR